MNNRRKVNRQRWILVATSILVLAAWIWGFYANQSDAAPQVLKILDGATRVENLGEVFVGLDQQGQVIGYAAVGKSQGYGGPIEVLVAVDPDGLVTGIEILEQRETPGFFRLLEREDYTQQFVGRGLADPVYAGSGVEAVTGATLSSEGVAASIRQAVRKVAKDGFSTSLAPEQKQITFGLPEIILIGLYIAGYFGHRMRSPVWKKRIRWGTLLTGMVALGFIYTAPLTIAQIITFLSGYWPDWHNNLYWYLLIGGILFVTTTQSKNPYCNWFCPFGAFQECLSVLTGSKHYRPRRLHSLLLWTQRGLALTAILLGLITRQPGVAGYEPFQALFDLKGSVYQWVFLGIIALASLMIYRPFCNYLCPMAPVVDFIGEVRRWITELRRQWQTKTTTG